MPIRKPRQLRLLTILFSILAVLILSSSLLYSNFKDVAEHEYWVLHTAEVMSELDGTLSSVKDTETGVRGYLLTNREEYLEPYRTGVLEANEHLQKVRDLTTDNPAQQAAVDLLDQTIKKRFSMFEDLIRQFQKDGGVVRREDLQFSEGKAIMDSLRAQVEKMRKVEEKLMEKRSQATEKSRSIFFLVLMLTTVLIIVVLFATFLQIGRNQERTEQEAQLKAKEAFEKDIISDLGRTIAGDISFERAGAAVLKFLAERVGGLAGKIWVVQQGRLVALSALATTGGGDAEKIAGDAGDSQGLVEEALSRSGVWRIAGVPENYWKISSGLGTSKPNEIAFLPFSFQGRKLGVIELASFEPFREETLQLLALLADTIGVGINAAQSRTQLQSLLEKTQLQSEELQTQQEELKTNNEELEQQARALESQQQALNLKNRELEMKAIDLQNSSRYKSEFLAKMSHELRTPLNGLMILSTLLIENKEKNLTEQQRQFARSIHSAGSDLLNLISDILDLSKVEARKLSLRPEDFSLKDLFESKHRNFNPQAAAKNLQFNVRLPEDLENVVLHTDRQRLEQILRNFLSNAIKFTEQGQISLEAKLNVNRDLITISVRDTGIGIPKNKQQLIFEAFEQADSSVSRKYGGTGLGLTISRELASLLGGQITVISEDGKGSIFSVQIPLKLPGTPSKGTGISLMAPAGITNTFEEPPEIQVGNSQRVQQGVQQALKDIPQGQKTILVVEDDDSFRSSVVEAVKAYGFAPIEANDGEVAMAIVNEHSPDAILLDIKLPGISGLGILEMIKKMPHLRHIPVHMISALDYQNNALRMGALGYLTKPVTIEKVRSALGRIENMISKKLRRVLLIEDDERQNAAIAQLIAGNDIEVESVKTGKAAVEKLKTSGFDCIILDLTLPDVSGFDLLSELRALEISLPPVVIYTGKDLSDEEERYLRKYSESIIIKGARSPERLLDEVNLFLHRVESLLPEAKREMLTQLRSQEKTFEGKTILIADDDIRNVFALTSALETRGLQVRVARDGVEALEFLEKYRDIDLVLMDIMMPRMDGFEAMRKIRQSQDPHLKSIPIVALTAKAMKDDHEKCMEAGASDYLPKPVNLENLTTVLKVWLTPKGLLS